MPKKNQTPVFLNVYKNKDNVETFQQFEITKQEDGSYAAIPNTRSLDENGMPKIRAMNRAARRLTPEYKEKRKLTRS